MKTLSGTMMHVCTTQVAGASFFADPAWYAAFQERRQAAPTPGSWAAGVARAKRARMHVLAGRHYLQHLQMFPLHVAAGML